MTNKTSLLIQKNKSKQFWLIFFILILFILGWYFGLRFGAISYTHTQVLHVLRHPFENSKLQDVIFDLRLPRTIAAILTGAALSQTGAIIQGVTRNPIADPELLGINAGAGLALVLGYAIFGILHYSLIMLICLIGSCLAALLIFLLSYQTKKGYQPLRLILAGTMITTLFSSFGQAITILFSLSTLTIGLQAGGLGQTNWKMVIIIGPFIILGLFLAQLFSHQLTILSLNETVSKSLGQKTITMTLILLGIVVLLSSAAVALIGTVSFIGIIIPHFIRLFTPRNYRLLLPQIALTGATFMLWVDLLSRIINLPSEAPISAIISIIGLPFFIFLIRKESKS